MQLAEQFRSHFGHRDHLYGVWLTMLADDLEADGPTAAICRDHLEAPRGEAIQLRLLAGIQRLVLHGEAPGLDRFFAVPAADPSDSWPALRTVLVTHEDELRAALDQAPQTNETGRSACLIIGLFEAVRRRGMSGIRLLEPGASAGLNLLVDRFRFIGPDWSWGPRDSPLVLDTECAGVRPEALQIVSRRGCDLDPVDLSTEEGRVWLRSFVWPFDLERRARLGAALEVAARQPVTVDQAPASVWIREQLAVPQPDDVLTVVWQSITEQYWPSEESAAVAAAIAQAGDRVCHVSMEGVPPTQTGGGYRIAEHGPKVRVDGEVIARSHHHGPPVLLV